MKIRTLILLNLIIIILMQPNVNQAKENQINVAVSANFLSTLKLISEQFEKKYSCTIVISADSTANIFTKIKNGAPFDVFISADSKHPVLLENTLSHNMSHIYAYGKIILWTKKNKLKKNLLINLEYIKNLSIANPKLSPYGKASKKTYNNLKIKKDKIILGSNINQTFNFIYSNNSEIGIIAQSQILHNKITKTHSWKIPHYLYPTIEQRIIILKNSYLSDKLIKYIKSQEIKTIIKNAGYKIEK